MTVQPLAPPATDLEILQSLDFDAVVPCILPPPFHQGAPATLIVSADVHGCNPAERALICRPCWDLLGTFRIPGKHLHCNKCGACLTRDDAFRIVGPVGGAS